jgi:hypothetical protein
LFGRQREQHTSIHEYTNCGIKNSFLVFSGAKTCKLDIFIIIIIPMAVIDIFFSAANPSSRTLAPGLTQPVNRNEYRKIFGGYTAGV